MKFSKISFLMLPFLLSGCTDNGLLLRSNGEYENKGDNVIYMVGEPYQIQNQTFVPEEDYAYIEEGEAGWYEYDKEHPITQNGETYQKDVLMGMHRTLPLPSIVKITNLENNKSAVVRINERGPMVMNRIVDVSKETADVLGFNKDKTTKVLIEIMPNESKEIKKTLLENETKEALSNSHISFAIPELTTIKPVIAPVKKVEVPVKKTEEKSTDVVYTYAQHAKLTQGYIIQLGAFKNKETALGIQNGLTQASAFIVEKNVNGIILNCVQVGGLKSKEEALIMLDKIKRAGYPDARIMTK